MNYLVQSILSPETKRPLTQLPWRHDDIRVNQQTFKLCNASRRCNALVFCLTVVYNKRLSYEEVITRFIHNWGFCLCPLFRCYQGVHKVEVDIIKVTLKWYSEFLTKQFWSLEEMLQEITVNITFKKVLTVIHSLPLHQMCLLHQNQVFAFPFLWHCFSGLWLLTSFSGHPHWHWHLRHQLPQH